MKEKGGGILRRTALKTPNLFRSAETSIQKNDSYIDAEIRELINTRNAAYYKIKALQRQRSPHSKTTETLEPEKCDTDQLFNCLMNKGKFATGEKAAFNSFVNTSSFAIFASLITARAKVDEQMNIKDPDEMFDRIMRQFLTPMLTSSDWILYLLIHSIIFL